MYNLFDITIVFMLFYGSYKLYGLYKKDKKGFPKKITTMILTFFFGVAILGSAMRAMAKKLFRD